MNITNLKNLWKQDTEPTLRKNFSKEYMQAVDSITETMDDFGIEFESELTRTFFSRGYLTTDINITKTLGEDTVVEGYLFPEGIQIFRSLNFLKFGSYSVETLLEVPFTTLFYRPEFVNRLMAKEIERVIAGPMKVSKFNVATHILKEVYQGHDKMYEMTLGHIAPIAKDGHNIGFLCTYKAKEVFN